MYSPVVNTSASVTGCVLSLFLSRLGRIVLFWGFSLLFAFDSPAVFCFVFRYEDGV